MKEEAVLDVRRQRLLDPLFTTETMRGIFSDHGRVQAMLDFEAALARAEARAGVVPGAAAAAIGGECRADFFDLDALAAGAAMAGNPAIPLINQLTARVAAVDPDAARYVHWGATSQDAMDTGLVLQLRSALTSIEADLSRLSAALAALARAHARTPLAGRTWLQQGPPVTLGLKAAGFLSAIERHRSRVADLGERIATLQFGGAVGTLAALGDRAMEVAAALADELQLALPDLPWHAQRDRVAEVATTLGLIVGTLGKLGRDVSLLMQTEVAEAFEPSTPGRGGSSTMPHKRNPVGSAVMLAAAVRVPPLVATMLAAMVQEHERALGGWQAEWDTLPEICMLAGGALARAIEVVEGLQLDSAQMSANLEATHGLILAESVATALGAKIGKMKAHELLEEASARAVRERRHLREVLEADERISAHLKPADLEQLLDPRHYTGQSAAWVERALNARKRERDGDDD
jgi:3-carboxy-cis,cis-muconate cycloisomerase